MTTAPISACAVARATATLLESPLAIIVVTRQDEAE